MATSNSFDLLGDITQLLQNLLPPVKKSPPPAAEAKFSSKPLPPAQCASRETEKPINDGQENANAENQLGQEDVRCANKENPVTEAEEKEPGAKDMTLEEYEKVLEEKRKALVALNSEERKVNLDKDFESMQLFSSKNEEEIFVKLAINLVEFLKPTEGERYYGPSGRGGRGRGARGGSHGFGGRNRMNNFAPRIEDASQFPTPGAK